MTKRQLHWLWKGYLITGILFVVAGAAVIAFMPLAQCPECSGDRKTIWLGDWTCCGTCDGNGHIPFFNSWRMKNDPSLAYWSNCRPESWVKIRRQTEQGGQTLESKYTLKLLELKPEKVTLECEDELEAPYPPSRFELQGKLVHGDRIENEGDEELELLGRKISCHWYEMTRFVRGAGLRTQREQVKMWMTKEIPGGILKNERHVNGQWAVIEIAEKWEKK